MRRAGGRDLTPRERPDWWTWELELSPRLMKRVEDRQFTELDLRRMLDRVVAIRVDVVPYRWIIATRYHRRHWEIIVEPNPATELLVVITAYPVQ